MKNIAVVLAGGSGMRLGAEVPKQFLTVGGRLVIEHSIEAFEQNPHIHEVAIVAHSDYLEQVSELVKRNGWKKISKILPGGKERYFSTLSAVKAFENESDDVNLIFHDAARPMISQEVINRVTDSLQEHEALGLAVPCTDTVFCVENNEIKSIPDRNNLRRAQTPQAFRLEVIRKAYEIALQDEGFVSTDDCGVVLKYLPQVSVKIVEGDEKNIKITYPEDLLTAERLLNGQY